MSNRTDEVVVVTGAFTGVRRAAASAYAFARRGAPSTTDRRLLADAAGALAATDGLVRLAR
jgi:NAD(P)-dependent dehydrogenase (short-subunit alcohol dehydrogenase family)